MFYHQMVQKYWTEKPLVAVYLKTIALAGYFSLDDEYLSSMQRKDMNKKCQTIESRWENVKM